MPAVMEPRDRLLAGIAPLGERDVRRVEPGLGREDALVELLPPRGDPRLDPGSLELGCGVVRLWLGQRVRGRRIRGRLAEMDGVLPILFLAVILKIPVFFGLWLIWWAVRAEPELEDAPGDAGDHTFKRWRRHPSKPRGPPPSFVRAA